MDKKLLLIIFNSTVVSDHIDLDNFIACFPYLNGCVVNDKSSSRCIPKSSRCKKI